MYILKPLAPGILAHPLSYTTPPPLEGCFRGWVSNIRPPRDAVKRDSVYHDTSNMNNQVRGMDFFAITLREVLRHFCG